MGRAGKTGLAQALLVVAALIAITPLRDAAGPLTPLQIVLAVLALEFVVQPISTLIHELGHAAVARRLTTKPVTADPSRNPTASTDVARGGDARHGVPSHRVSGHRSQAGHRPLPRQHSASWHGLIRRANPSSA
jgi:hypothetical protein